MPHTPGHLTPTPPKIGQNATPWGPGFLGKQNLPGQSMVPGGGSWPSIQTPGTSTVPTTGSVHPAAGAIANYHMQSPGGYSQTPDTGQSGAQQSINNGVVSVTHNGNPITSPEMFDQATLKALNDGTLMFGGRQGPQSLQGMLTRSLVNQGPNASTSAVRTLQESTGAPSGAGQASDTGGRGWSPNDLGGQSGNVNAANWAAAQAQNPALRDPNSVAGLPVGAPGADQAVGGINMPQPSGTYLNTSGYGAGAANTAPGGGTSPGLPPAIPPGTGGYPRPGAGGNDPRFQSGPWDVQTNLDRLNANVNTPGTWQSDRFDPSNNAESAINAYNLQGANAMLPAIQGVNPYLPMTTSANQFSGGNQDLLQLMGGPFFDHPDAVGIASAEGGASLGAASNLRMAQMLEGGARGQQREQMLQFLTDEARRSSQAAGGEQLAQQSNMLMDPALLDERYADLRRNATEVNAGGLNAARNRMSDLGLAGGGMGQAPALLAAEQGANRDLNQTLLQLGEMQAQERRQNLQTAAGGLGTSAGIYDQFQTRPMTNQVASLIGSQNTMVDPFANQLERNAQIAQGVALQNQGQGNMGALLSLGGGVAGGVLGGIYGGGWPGAQAGFALGSAGGNAAGSMLDNQ